jgi:ABC-type tungstate transport system substrate-binding protein
MSNNSSLWLNNQNKQLSDIYYIVKENLKTVIGVTNISLNISYIMSNNILWLSNNRQKTVIILAILSKQLLPKNVIKLERYLLITRLCFLYFLTYLHQNTLRSQVHLWVSSCVPPEFEVRFV